MKNNFARSHVAFKLYKGKPVLAWARCVEDRKLYLNNDKKNQLFEDFPNIDSPEEMLRVFSRFSEPPLRAERVDPANIRNIKKPRDLLAVFTDSPTRTEIRKANELINLDDPTLDYWEILPVSDCIAMTRDMKAILSLLLYSYDYFRDETREACPLESLLENTKYGFRFGITSVKCQSPYFNFITDDNPYRRQLDATLVNISIEEITESETLQPDRETIEFFKDMAEKWISGFMWKLHRTLHDMKLGYQVPRYDLSSIYEYWADRAVNNKARVCLYCNKLIAEGREDKQYCSESCRSQARKKRKSVAKAAQS